MKDWLMHGYFVPAASRLPDAVLRFLGCRLPFGPDDGIGWSYWMDARYLRWCRFDRTRSADALSESVDREV